MAKTIKDTDYLVISARVKALETGLLTAERMEQILDAKSGEDAVIYLTGEFFADELALAEHVKAADLEVPLRNIGIFLK